MRVSIRQNLQIIGAGLWATRRIVLLALIVATVLGEAYLSAPWALPRLEYAFDAELRAAFVPHQRGFLWMGTDAIKSEPITINGAGFRGAEVDPARRLWLVLGDSQAMGVGVADAEVWTSLLQQELRDRYGSSSPQVVNAALAGGGPADQRVVLNRWLKKYPAERVLVWVSIGDRNFVAVDGDPVAVEARRLAAERRARVRRITKFAPYILDKVNVQLPEIREAFVPWMFRTQIQSGGQSIDAAETMWNTFGADWRAIAERSTEEKFSLVFIVHDPLGRMDSGELARRLRQIARTNPGIEVLDLGPEVFQLSNLPAQLRSSEYALKYTLLRDPHGNAAQHKIIASAVGDFLKSP